MKLSMFLLLLVTNEFGASLCPEKCDCSVDEKGRKVVLCGSGGLVDPIPIANTDRDVEVFKIWAPPDASNMLTIGPIFQKFSRLEELDVVRSGVPAIGRHSFWGLSTLRVLNLTENEISHLLESNFRGLENLVRLHLDGNKIESMPSESFRHLRQLRVLTLARNKIVELVPRIFLRLGKLQELDLSSNPLDNLNPEVFKDIRTLKVFRCRSCDLTKMEALFFRLLGDLTEVDLGNNRLKFIYPESLSAKGNLKILRLDGNWVSEIDEGTFGGNEDFGRTSLHLIDLSGNRLTNIGTRAFVNMTALRDLNLSYNLLSRLEPATFLPVVNSLRNLDLSGNSIPIGDLKFVVQLLSELNCLSLADMKLIDLPLGMFAQNENLMFLNLSGNRFVHFSPQIFHSFNRVRTLDLSKNRFRGLSEKVFVLLEKIPNLIMKGNPWACDLCHIPSILNRVNEPETRAVFGAETCYSPRALTGTPLVLLKGDQVRWCEGGVAGVLGEPPSWNGFPASPLFLVASVSSALALAVALAAAACVLFVRRRSAYYYTREESRIPEEVTFDRPSDDVRGNETPAWKASAKKVSIAVIDELSKDPETEALTPGV